MAEPNNPPEQGRGSRSRRRRPDEGDSVDPVTGLPGRNELTGWIAHAAGARNAGRFAVVLVGLGNVRDINELHGVEIGDAAIEYAGAMLVQQFRNAKVARYSGSMLAVFATGFRAPEEVEELGGAAIQVVSRPVRIADQVVELSAYAGGYLGIPGSRAPAEVLLDGFNTAKAARDGGGPTVTVFDEVKHAGQSGTRTVTDSMLRTAFENGDFVIVYQPIVVVQTGKVVGFHALLRWLDPRRGASLTRPEQFLPALEKSSMAVPVSSWVMDEACRQVAEWSILAGDSPLFVAVNIAGRQLSDPAFAVSVVDSVSRNRLRPDQVVLNLTASALTHPRSVTWPRLRDLKAAGVRLAINEIGVGSASLDQLVALRVDAVRIPQAFLAQCPASPDDSALVANLVTLAHDLGLVAFGVGVERQDQLDFLVTCGADLAQGYLFGRPERADAFAGRFNQPGEKLSL